MNFNLNLSELPTDLQSELAAIGATLEPANNTFGARRIGPSELAVKAFRATINVVCIHRALIKKLASSKGSVVAAGSADVIIAAKLQALLGIPFPPLTVARYIIRDGIDEFCKIYCPSKSLAKETRRYVERSKKRSNKKRR